MPTRLPQPSDIKTVADLIDALGGPTAFARAITGLNWKSADGRLELKESAATEIRRRSRDPGRSKLPLRYWDATIHLAKLHKVPVNHGDLLHFHGVGFESKDRCAA